MNDRLDLCIMFERLDKKPEDEKSLKEEIYKKVQIILDNYELNDNG